ncbi:hypothetical protein TSUD_13480, partial [Trifolium subterraneum]
MTNTAKEFPDFFKVFLKQQHYDRMLIPVAFVKLMHSKRKVIKDFILRNHRGRDWHVKARPIGGKLYFDDGDMGRNSADSKLEDDEIKAEIYVQPGNPYFIAKPLHYRPNELDVQSNEIAYYHNIQPQMNANHAEKRGKVRKWTNGRVLVLGWTEFCKKSKIRENDTCLCEIVLRGNDEAIEMIRVHVVRNE